MILEYNSFSQQLRNNIIIEVINDGRYLDFILNEEFHYNYYDFYHRLKINKEHKSKLKEIEKEVESYLKTNINPFKGKFVSKVNGQSSEITYNIVTTEHFYLKFFRQDFEDRKKTIGFVKPNLHEGIDLIYNNADEITRLICLQSISDGNHVLIRTKDRSIYSIIIIFEKINPKEWRLKLKTQMKGVEYKDDRQYDVVRKLHPNGPLIKKPPIMGV